MTIDMIIYTVTLAVHVRRGLTSFLDTVMGVQNCTRICSYKIKMGIDHVVQRTTYKNGQVTKMVMRWYRDEVVCPAPLPRLPPPPCWAYAADTGV